AICLQLLEGKWLGEVVVSPLIQTPDLVRHGITSSEQQDWHAASVFSYLLQHSQTITLRQHEVEDQQVIVAVNHAGQPGLPVVGHIDRVMFGLQPTLDKTGDFLFVFDDQDVHKGSQVLGVDRSFPLRLVVYDPQQSSQSKVL